MPESQKEKKICLSLNCGKGYKKQEVFIIGAKTELHIAYCNA